MFVFACFGVFACVCACLYLPKFATSSAWNCVCVCVCVFANRGRIKKLKHNENAKNDKHSRGSQIHLANFAYVGCPKKR